MQFRRLQIDLRDFPVKWIAFRDFKKYYLFYSSFPDDISEIFSVEYMYTAVAYRHRQTGLSHSHLFFLTGVYDSI